MYNHINTIFECLTDENAESHNNKLDFDIIINQSEESSLNLNRYAAFLWRKTFNIHESIIKLQKNKLKIAKRLKIYKPFLIFLKEEFLSRIIKLENANLHQQVNPYKVLEKIKEINRESDFIKSENTTYNKTKVIRSAEKIRTHKDMIYQGIFIVI